MLFYPYRKSHCGDKTIVRSSYLHNANSYTGKMAYLYWISPLRLWSHYFLIIFILIFILFLFFIYIQICITVGSYHLNVHDLVQDVCISIAKAMVIPESCTTPSICNEKKWKNTYLHCLWMVHGFNSVLGTLPTSIGDKGTAWGKQKKKSY